MFFSLYPTKNALKQSKNPKFRDFFALELSAHKIYNIFDGNTYVYYTSTTTPNQKLLRYT